jgi:hypothetical protein
MFGGLEAYDLYGERREELAWEAEAGRLAREVRRGRAPSVGGSVRVRWGLEEDYERAAGLLELNGAPRWIAFEERFILAEEEGRLLGALVYRTEPKRMRLGLLLVDPWAGEERVATALYRGAAELAVELGVKEVRARGEGRYLARSGYRPGLGDWRTEPRAASRVPEGRLRKLLALWGVPATPFFRAFRR